MLENGIEIAEITDNFAEKIRECLGKSFKVHPDTQKIFIAKTKDGPFAVYVTANHDAATIRLYIFLSTIAEKPYLVESNRKILQILPEKYKAEKVIIKLEDNEGIIKQSLQAAGFSVTNRNGRAITLEKKLHKKQPQ